MHQSFTSSDTGTYIMNYSVAQHTCQCSNSLVSSMKQVVDLFLDSCRQQGTKLFSMQIIKSN